MVLSQYTLNVESGPPLEPSCLKYMFEDIQTSILSAYF
jgi:hypothetical protein